jgi:hypothetical protein
MHTVMSYGGGAEAPTILLLQIVPLGTYRYNDTEDWPFSSEQQAMAERLPCQELHGK